MYSISITTFLPREKAISAMLPECERLNNNFIEPGSSLRKGSP
jgi:hypothetical protein